jgi:uncharacterized protein (DUF1015 family)
MSLIRPFRGLRPAPGRAGEVAAPPYDVLSSDEARSVGAAGKPWSFLHISKPEIDLPREASTSTHPRSMPRPPRTCRRCSMPASWCATRSPATTPIA